MEFVATAGEVGVLHGIEETARRLGQVQGGSLFQFCLHVPCQRFDGDLTATTHDSGPGWIAIPFLYDSFIHNASPVLSRRTQQPARNSLIVCWLDFWQVEQPGLQRNYVCPA